MAPQKNPHYLSINIAARALTTAFGENYWIRAQGPLHLAEACEPEPDVAVVNGPMDSYTDHPTSAHLVVEVSDSTLRFDRGKKASLYARAGIQDYWIINLTDSCVEVLREPVEDPKAHFGFSYRSIVKLRPPQSIAPLAQPIALIPITDLLP